MSRYAELRARVVEYIRKGEPIPVEDGILLLDAPNNTETALQLRLDLDVLPPASPGTQRPVGHACDNGEVTRPASPHRFWEAL